MHLSPCRTAVRSTDAKRVFLYLRPGWAVRGLSDVAWFPNPLGVLPLRSDRPRRCFFEPLEDRSLMAIAADLTGGNFSIAGDAGANDLQITNLAGNTYLLASATDNITITDNDATLTLLNNGTGLVTVTAPAAAIKNIAIDLKGSGDTLTLNALIGSAAAALKSLAVNDTGTAGTDLVKLNGNISIDGSLTLAGVENALLTSSVAIDTEQGNNSNAGSVDLSGAVVSADAVGRDLAIDANTGVGFTDGVAILGVFSNAPGPQLVHNLTISGGTATSISSEIHTSGDQTYNDATTISDDVTLTGSNVVFSGPLDDDGNAGTTSNLIVNTTGGGTTAFGSEVGGVHPLDSLTTNADGTTQINGGTVATTGDQTYNDLVTLSNTTTHLTTFSGQNIVVAATGSLNGNAASGTCPPGS